MGKRGPTPAPTALRLVRGERKDRINKAEPIPAKGDVAPPKWLNKQAREVWDSLAADLKAKAVLTPWDVEQYANYCDAVVRRERAASHLDVEGEVLELPVFGKNGEQTGYRLGRNPWFLVWKDADEQLRRYAARFGLTPSDRSQVIAVDRGAPAKRGRAERLLS